MWKHHVLIAALLAVNLLSVASGEPRALSLEDYYRLATVSDPHLSPDGRWVAYVVSRLDQARNRKLSAIWIAAADGAGAPRQFTYEGNSSYPRWGPDGETLAFLSARAAGPDEPARNQVWALSMHGGEARQLTRLQNVVTGFQWSPDGKRLAVVSRSGPAESSRSRGDERVYLNPWYKFDGSGFYNDQRSHIWIVDIASGAAVEVTRGNARDDTDPRWSPDGTRIAFAGTRLDAPFGLNEDVWTVTASGGAPSRISDHTARVSKPAWSHDGRSIAYVAAEENEVPKVWVAPAAGGKSVLAARDFTFPEELEWSGDDHAILAIAPWHGATLVFRLDLGRQMASPLIRGERSVSAADSNERAERMAYVAADGMHAGDLYAADLSGNGERQLTRVNQELWNEIAVEPIERVPFRGADGWPIDGFLISPHGRKPGVKYPMILSVHGGPNAMFGMSWSHEVQVFAARGYAVFFTNPRGSCGYGEAFQRGVEGEWGGKAFEDIMAGVDEVLRRYLWLDGGRMAVRGQSYGGYMTNWIVSHTDRFRAAATLSGIADLISDEGVRDAYYGHAHDFGGNLLERFDSYWNQSPLKYARNVHTPVLILHGDADQRVPLSQGEEWFRALRYFGKTAEFVVYPHESHSLRSEPNHSISVTRRQLEWFDRYLKNGEAR